MALRHIKEICGNLSELRFGIKEVEGGGWSAPEQSLILKSRQFAICKANIKTEAITKEAFDPETDTLEQDEEVIYCLLYCDEHGGFHLAGQSESNFVKHDGNQNVGLSGRLTAADITAGGILTDSATVKVLKSFKVCEDITLDSVGNISAKAINVDTLMLGAVDLDTRITALEKGIPNGSVEIPDPLTISSLTVGGQSRGTASATIYTGALNLQNGTSGTPMWISGTDTGSLAISNESFATLAEFNNNSFSVNTNLDVTGVTPLTVTSNTMSLKDPGDLQWEFKPHLGKNFFYWKRKVIEIAYDVAVLAKTMRNRLDGRNQVALPTDNFQIAGQTRTAEEWADIIVSLTGNVSDYTDTLIQNGTGLTYGEHDYSLDESKTGALYDALKSTEYGDSFSGYPDPQTLKGSVNEVVDALILIKTFVDSQNQNNATLRSEDSDYWTTVFSTAYEYEKLLTLDGGINFLIPPATENDVNSETHKPVNSSIDLTLKSNTDIAGTGNTSFRVAEFAGVEDPNEESFLKYGKISTDRLELRDLLTLKDRANDPGEYNCLYSKLGELYWKNARGEVKKISFDEPQV